jgi:hypothetical protein
MDLPGPAKTGFGLCTARNAQESWIHRDGCLSLALGMGANAAIFSLIDALMLRRLPVSHPEQLAELLGRGSHDLVGAPSQRYNAFSWPTYLHLRDANTVFSGLIGAHTDRFNHACRVATPNASKGNTSPATSSTS